MTNVSRHIETSQLIRMQIKWLLSIWRETLVANELKNSVLKFLEAFPIYFEYIILSTDETKNSSLEKAYYLLPQPYQIYLSISNLSPPNATTVLIELMTSSAMLPAAA